jgi:chromosome condensin MukBEF complex kleisin-like MukF subunit
MSELANIMEQLKQINERLEKLEKSSDKMSNHIDFVENIYTRIKYPFHFIMDKISTNTKLINDSQYDVSTQQRN